MPDREKVISEFEDFVKSFSKRDDTYYKGLFVSVLALLKEQKVPEELKLKIWNALYTKEDEYEKKLIEADKCHEWFSIYRPWLQIGFNIAIDAIAEWEGR